MTTELQDESIRLMQENAASMNQTTEARLKDVRESMTFTKAKSTIRRTGWYFTEAYAPCQEAVVFDRREA
jgi:hypothetical protein